MAESALQLRVQLHRANDIHGYLARVEDLPGCVAMARSISELRKAIGRAITEHLHEATETTVADLQWDTPTSDWMSRIRDGVPVVVTAVIEAPAGPESATA
jgi:predicted RNase H-like HicB family nuclease